MTIHVAVCGPDPCSEEVARQAEEIGRGLARAGAIVVCGGLGGTMEAAARGALAAPEVALEHRLDELGHELAEVRVQAVDVLGALALRQVALGPREREVDVGVERVLRRSHGPDPFDGPGPTPGPRRRRAAARRPGRAGGGSAPPSADAS